nr:hypothetical protein [Kibdelosporangium sp. MJ126-NF4]
MRVVRIEAKVVGNRVGDRFEIRTLDDSVPVGVELVEGAVHVRVLQVAQHGFQASFR